MNIIPEQLDAAIQIVIVLGETIKELGRVPNGKLYAEVMPLIPIDAYNKAIRVLKSAGLVMEVNHELIWVTNPALN